MFGLLHGELQKYFMKIKFLVIFNIFLVFLILVNADEIFWRILTQQMGYDIGNYELIGYQDMPLSCRYFCRKSKNQFLISKFGECKNVYIEFLGYPLAEGDLAWCIWSSNTLSEKDYENIAEKFNVITGIGVFHYIYKNEEHKNNILNYLSENGKK